MSRSIHTPRDLHRPEILDGMARGLWVLAWAQHAAEQGEDLAELDLEDAAPPTPDGAEHAAAYLASVYEHANGKTLDELAAAAGADGQLEAFGRDLAMMALGTGVSWFDDHPRFPLRGVDAELWFDGEELHIEAAPSAKPTRNPATFTRKGERMYEHVKASVGGPRAKEIAARTVYARAHQGATGLLRGRRNPPLSTAARERIPTSQFADRRDRKLPLEDAAHVRAAMSRYGRTVFASKAAAEDAHDAILRAAERFGIDASGFRRRWG